MLLSVVFFVYLAIWFATTAAISVLSPMFNIEERWHRGLRPVIAGMLWPLVTLGVVQAGLIVLLAAAVRSWTRHERASADAAARPGVLVPIRGRR